MSALAFKSAPEAIASPGEFSLTDAERHTICASFDRIEPAADLVATLFFLRLFDKSPKLRRHFEGPIKPHARELSRLMAEAVGALDGGPAVKPRLKAIGARFRKEGVRPGDYDQMAKAMIWTLEKSLQSDFPYSAKRAWNIYLAQITSALTIA